MKRSITQEDPKVSSKKLNSGYTGWQVPSSEYNIDTISIDDITPEAFYYEYVAQRRPVVIKGFIKDNEWKAYEKWTNNYLREKAGQEKLDIEKRDSINDSFGKGKEVSMEFGQFLDLLEKGNAMHYLTTQNVHAKVDDRPDLMAPFMKLLKQDFPIRPALMGNLIPQNINLWMGNNKEGSTSGLHHDYHDNLYLVLRGKKKFQLFSPQDAPNMYTRGSLAQIHPNGRINYDGELTTAAGADLKAEAAVRAMIAKEEAEKQVAKAEEEIEQGVEGAEERLHEAEERLEQAMEDMLDAEVDDDEDDEDESDSEFEQMDQKVLEAQDAMARGDPNAQLRLQQVANELDEQMKNGIDTDTDEMTTDNRIADQTVKDPLNFSTVNLNLSQEELAKQFPEFIKAKVARCEVETGHMLYLPASWFHEVQSYGGSNESGHLAFNYWFHPPDCSPASFEHPYATNFWPNDWKNRIDSSF